MNENFSRGRPESRATLLAFAIAIFVCLFGHLGAIGFTGPDEPRYAWIARAMTATGDWVTPRLYGQPWFEKPALYYWCAGLGFRLHLAAEWAARLPSAFAALAAAIAIGWLGRRFYPGDRGSAQSPAVIAPLLFSTSVAAIGFARAAAPDMLFGAMITLAMASAASVLQRSGALRGAGQASVTEGRDILPLLLFGVFLGFGVLAKGPAGVILAGGAVFVWALATKRWRAAFRLAHPATIVAFCAGALPWYVLCAARNPDFLRVFILQHNFERYLTPVFQHRQPFWFFGPMTLAALAPWTVLLWPAATQGLRVWREKSWSDSPGFFFLCWAVFPVLFFSFSQSKLPSYIVPAIPPLALVCAIALDRVNYKEPHQHVAIEKGIRAGLGVTWVALGAGAAIWGNRLPAAERDALLRPVLALALFAVASGAAIVLLGVFRMRMPIVAVAILAALSVEFAGERVLPKLDPFISSRWHGEFVEHASHPERIFTYRVDRSWHYGLAFYLGRELKEWSPEDPGPALVLTTPDELEDLRRLGRVHGELEESAGGIVYAPVGPVPRLR